MGLLGPAPPLPLFEGPLYVSGRRRPGPSRWGFDPYAPPLDPAEDPRDGLPRFKRRAIAYWGRETFERRRDAVPELRERLRGRRSKRRGTVVTRAEPRRFKRGDRTSAHHRFAKFIAAHADAQTGEVGLWIGGGRHRRLRLYEIADRVGLSPDQADRVVRDFVAAGFIFRHQARELDGSGVWRGGVALMRVCARFWQCCAADGMRRAFIDRMQRKATKRARKAATPLLEPAGYSAPGARSLRAYVEGLAMPAPWPPKGSDDDPPPK